MIASARIQRTLPLDGLENFERTGLLTNYSSESAILNEKRAGSEGCPPLFR